jgi:hypothetical protein
MISSSAGLARPSTISFTENMIRKVIKKLIMLSKIGIYGPAISTKSTIENLQNKLRLPNPLSYLSSPLKITKIKL